MAYWKKGDDKTSEIKRAIERPSPSLDDMPLPEGMSPKNEQTSILPKPIPPVQTISMLKTQMPPSPPKGDIVRKAVVTKYEGQDDGAHVFVKVDRYDQILDKLDTLKDIIQHQTDIIGTMLEVDELKNDVFSSLRSSLDVMSDSLGSLDGEFLRPENKKYESREDPRIDKLKEDIELLRTKVAKL